MAEPQVKAPDGIKPAGLMVRLATGIVYAAVILGAIWFAYIPQLRELGPIVLAAVVCIMAGFASSEFYAMSRRESRLPNDTFGVAAAVLMPLAASIWGLGGLSATVTALIAVSLVWHVVFVRVRATDTALTVFGAVYTGFLLAYLVLIVRNFSHGQILALAVVLGVWANDSLAYLVGSTVGRTKMMPRISPKKSWEGFIAGALGTLIVWVSLALALPYVGVSLPLALVIGAVVGASVVIGDLFESRLKREAGVKDAGHILPGHGGFLDRLDSLILVGLLAYWLLWWGGVR